MEEFTLSDGYKYSFRDLQIHTRRKCLDLLKPYIKGKVPNNSELRSKFQEYLGEVLDITKSKTSDSSIAEFRENLIAYQGLLLDGDEEIFRAQEGSPRQIEAVRKSTKLAAIVREIIYDCNTKDSDDKLEDPVDYVVRKSKEILVPDNETAKITGFNIPHPMGLNIKKPRVYLTTTLVDKLRDSKFNNGYLLALNRGSEKYSFMFLEGTLAKASAAQRLGKYGRRIKKDDIFPGQNYEDLSELDKRIVQSLTKESLFPNIEVIPYSKIKEKENKQRLSELLTILILNSGSPRPRYNFLSIIPDDIKLYTLNTIQGFSNKQLRDISEKLVYTTQQSFPEIVRKKIDEEKTKIEKVIEEESSKESQDFTKKLLSYARKKQIPLSPHLFHLLEMED